MARGDYYDATVQAASRLRGNPDHKKSRETLRISYPLAVELIETDVKNKMAANDPMKWAHAVGSYERLNRLAEEINRSPGARRIVPNPKTYHAQISDARANAAKESYDLGVTEMMKGNRQDFRRAYRHFQNVQRFDPNYRDAIDMAREAKFQATVKVVTLPVEVDSRLNINAFDFQENLENWLSTKYKDQEFLEFYTPARFQLEGLPFADHDLIVRFSNIRPGRPTIKKAVQKLEKDSVVTGERTVRGVTVPIYETVKAEATTFTKQLEFVVNVMILVRDSRTEAQVSSQAFDAKYIWTSEWATVNGHELALTEAIKTLAGKKEETPPGAQKLFNDFCTENFPDISRRIERIYSSY